MKSFHPNQRQVAFAAVLFAVTCLCGCQNPQTAATNPFFAPDRVPPPATRVVAPGTAQPYYPGQPLPTSQTPSSGAVAAPVVNTPPDITPITAATSPQPQPLAFSNERTVAIPADSQDLRFSLPAPPAIQPAPAAQPTVPQVAAAPASQSGVIPAAYNHSAVQASEVPTAASDNSGGPWRAPQVSAANPPVIQAPYVQPQAAPLAAPNAQQPPPAPPPRVRFPSLAEPSTWFTNPPAAPPAANQQLIGYMVPSSNGATQFVPIEQMQPAASAQQPASVASSDGFRPRGTTR